MKMATVSATDKTSQRWRGYIFPIIVHLIIYAGAVTMAIPFVWMLVTSLKEESQVFTWPVQWIPRPMNIRNYPDMWTAAPFNRFLINTVIYSVLTTAGSVFLSALAGFAFAKYRFPGRDKIFMALLATLMIPFHVTLIPVFVILKYLGWLNTYQGLIVPGLCNVFGIFLMRQFMQAIPGDLIDAARIDGCPEFTIFWRIIVPLSRPVIATLSIFVFMGTWNELFWPLIVTMTEDMRTLQVGLAGFRTVWYVHWPQMMAGSILATAPVFILFVSFQRYFVKGITLTGLKG